MSVREGLEFDAPIESDCAPLNNLVSEMLEVTKEIHVLRDATRGGAASILNEIAKSSNVGIRLQENSLPVPRAVRSACEMLGLDPLYVANEGRLMAILPRRFADEMLEKMRSNEYGKKRKSSARSSSNTPEWSLPKPASAARASLICSWANSCRAFVSFLNRIAQGASLVG